MENNNIQENPAVQNINKDSKNILNDFLQYNVKYICLF